MSDTLIALRGTGDDVLAGHMPGSDVSTDVAAVADVTGDNPSEWTYGQVRCLVHQIAETANDFARRQGWELVTTLADPVDPSTAHLVLRKRTRQQDPGALLP